MCLVDTTQRVSTLLSSPHVLTVNPKILEFGLPSFSDTFQTFSDIFS